MTVLEPKLLHHGEHVRTEYAPLPGEKEGPMGRSTDQERTDGHAVGIVKRFKKKERLNVRPMAVGWIKAIYKDAIEYTGMTRELRGTGFMIAMLGGPMILGGAVLPGIWLPLRIISDADHPWYVDLLGWVILPLVGLVFAAIALRGIILPGVHADLFPPSDQPILFDRRHRKVYCLMREVQLDRRNLLKPWPIIACEYDWDLIDAEHQADDMATGATVGRYHHLMFAVRKSADDPTIIDSFSIGNANMLSETLVPAMWEHIRRFMEEDGPHLPTPSEPLADLDAPPGWWASVGATGVFGPGYIERWKKQPGFMLFMHIAFPITLPMFLLWGTGNWLSYKTAVAVDWPEEVKQAVGEATARGAD